MLAARPAPAAPDPLAQLTTELGTEWLERIGDRWDTLPERIMQSPLCSVRDVKTLLEAGVELLLDTVQQLIDASFDALHDLVESLAHRLSALQDGPRHQPRTVRQLRGRPDESLSTESATARLIVIRYRPRPLAALLRTRLPGTPYGLQPEAVVHIVLVGLGGGRSRIIEGPLIAPPTSLGREPEPDPAKRERQTPSLREPRSNGDYEWKKLPPRQANLGGDSGFMYQH
jgi:hypothetical protein